MLLTRADIFVRILAAQKPGLAFRPSPTIRRCTILAVTSSAPPCSTKAAVTVGRNTLAVVFVLAPLPSDRDAKNLPALIAALANASEPMRWWAAQGCTMLGARAASAEGALRRRLADASGALQIVVAEALAALGKLDAALPVLERCLQNADTPAVISQAGTCSTALANGRARCCPPCRAPLRPPQPRPPAPIPCDPL